MNLIRQATIVIVLIGWSGAHADVEIVEPAYMEAGIGLVGQYIADYRGSKHYSLTALPIPYLLYEGRIFKADKDGVRGEFFSRTRYQLDISVGGSLHGESDDNIRRQGMPELLSSFELGPSFNIHLGDGNFDDGWSLRLPIRAVMGVDYKKPDLDYIGYLFNPRLNWRNLDIGGGWRISTNVGIMLADRHYHAYYYDVAPQYANPERAYYHAKGGFSGINARISTYREFGDWRLGMSFNYDNLNGAVFRDSPLVETDHFVSFSFGMTRTLWTNTP